MAIHWIEIRLYAEGPVQSGYNRMVIRHFFYSVAPGFAQVKQQVNKSCTASFREWLYLIEEGHTTKYLFPLKGEISIFKG